ncbi:MAG: sensor domain-containing protein, partial [Acidobacteriaceae bacterium]
MPLSNVLNVLCIEDVPEDAELYLRVLQEAGYQVAADVVCTREEFARKLESGSYDVVLSDHRMPGWSGTDALEVLKRSAKDIPFLLVTGTIGEEAAAECIKQGAADYILKDRPDRLPVAVRRALEEKAAREERARAEESLKLFRTLVDQSNDILLIVDPETMRFLDVNEKACLSLGYTREELLSMRVYDIDPTVSEPVRTKVFDELRKSGCAIFQGLDRRKDGSTFPVEVSMRLLHIDRSYVVCVTRDISERERTEKKMADALRYMQMVLDISPFGIITYKASGEAVNANPASAQLVGASIEQVRAQNFRDVESWRHSGLLALAEKALATGVLCHGEIHMTSTFGKEIWVHGHFAPFAHGDEPHLLAIFQDIAERKEAEKHLVHMEARYRRLLEAAPDAMVVVNQDGEIVLLNAQAERQFGYRRDELLGHKVQSIIPKGFAERLAADGTRTVEETLAQQIGMGIELEGMRKDGSGFPIEIMLSPLGSPKGILVTAAIRDITDRKAAEEKVQHLAYCDALTGLPNRILLQDRLTKALAGARRRKDKVALLFLDLDRFKDINNAFGHPLGDLLLQEFAKRLERCVREQDSVARLDVGRLNGDEFLIVLTGIKDISEAAVAAKRFMDTMTAEVAVQGHSLVITCSLGISIFPEHGADGETLLKNADAAMYCAKDRGRNNFQFFTEDMNAQIVERLTLESSLRLA